ncbi:unnamed protein product [Mytilus coruscus]|uniref:THAP-type domain-containing protein n=1 Tax=Mytilus coruscus TaxID=42192 RepID=A0A6J8DYM7_MYTCO|nr:unnamed protein product [Mytilus coruscus]
MGKGDRCSIGICNNDRRYPDKIVIRSHVTNFQFNGLPKDEKLRQIWHSKIHQGKKDYTENKNAKVCSNHFEDGERTFRCSFPTLFLANKLSVINESFTLSIASVQLSRDADVQFYTGLLNTPVFKTVFDHLSMKASVMHYWKGQKQTLQEAPMRYAMDDDPDLFVKPGPGRKLKLEIELLLVMMRLRCIIDCTEIFIETPSSLLDTQAQCWSDYKHHCTIEFLVAITPNGMFSYVSPCYGGRASDKFIFNNCAFIFNLEPNDQVMADRGFKIKEDLVVVQARLAIPPSTCGKLSMPSGDVLETSKIANVRIYVEQAIGRLKTFRFSKNEIHISCLPVCDDIVVVCCAACNLLDPLC